MITEYQITEIGCFNQPHGIKGEINAIISDGVDLDDLSCIVLDIDGIYVPFFLSGVRRRGVQSYLVMVDGIDDERKASSIANKTIFALAEEVGADVEDDGDGYFAEDFIGFAIATSDGSFSGTIADVDDSTDNVLFIVTTDDGETRLIPVAEEFIAEIDAEERRIIVELPDGLLNI